MLIKRHELLHKSKFEVLDEIYKNLTKPVMGRNNILHTHLTLVVTFLNTYGQSNTSLKQIFSDNGGNTP